MKKAFVQRTPRGSHRTTVPTLQTGQRRRLSGRCSRAYSGHGQPNLTRRRQQSITHTRTRQTSSCRYRRNTAKQRGAGRRAHRSPTIYRLGTLASPPPHSSLEVADCRPKSGVGLQDLEIFQPKAGDDGVVGWCKGRPSFGSVVGPIPVRPASGSVGVPSRACHVIGLDHTYLWTFTMPICRLYCRH